MTPRCLFFNVTCSSVFISMLLACLNVTVLPVHPFIPFSFVSVFSFRLAFHLHQCLPWLTCLPLFSLSGHPPPPSLLDFGSLLQAFNIRWRKKSTNLFFSARAVIRWIVSSLFFTVSTETKALEIDTFISCLAPHSQDAIALHSRGCSAFCQKAAAVVKYHQGQHSGHLQCQSRTNERN